MVSIDAMELAKMCARAADDAKAENVRVYDLRGMSSLTDFMVVCTGLSVPHLRAVIRDLEEAVREKDREPSPLTWKIRPWPCGPSWTTLT